MTSIAFLAGLPRSGSTLLANILAMHPQIHATPTSPLAPLVDAMRRGWSDDASLLAQLDMGYEPTYQRLTRATRAFIEAWSSAPDRALTIDKSRHWLTMIETVQALYPDFKMIVCLRDLRDVYKSIEIQHRKSLLLTFPGLVEQNLVEARAAQLFSPTGHIGGPLKALFNLNDVPDMRPHLYFWRFESFLQDPDGVTTDLLRWLDVEPLSLPLDQITQQTHESDSHVHFKFPHRISCRVTAPEGYASADLSPRILSDIVNKHLWYYRQFYRSDGVVRLDRDSPGA